MIQPDILTPVPLVESVAPVAPVSDPAQILPNFSAGQKFLAKVEAQLANGNFKVLVNGQALQMQLPENIRPGNTMELMLIASEPRLKFVLLGDGQARTGASLSATGRFLGALAQDAAGSLAAPPWTRVAPALSAPPVDSRQLPALLRDALSRSGLFYESHQAQWVAGKRTLGQLLQEPQGGLSTGASSRLIRVIEKPARNVNSEPEAAAAGAVRNANAPVHAQTLTLVQQQLSVLETGQLSWCGEIWPGQWMDWDIAEHRPAASETDAPSRWQTRLCLTLPKLGEVAATLALDPRGVRITLGATATGTAALLENSQQPLAAAMAAAGLSVLAVEVRHDARQ